jgi:hypothetical protein
METRVELKICEACGVIYTRPAGTESPYCARCEAILKDFPTPARRGRPLLPTNHGTHRKYLHGCRCRECKAANKARNREQKRRLKARKAGSK